MNQATIAERFATGVLIDFSKHRSRNAAQRVLPMRRVFVAWQQAESGLGHSYPAAPLEADMYLVIDRFT